VRTKTEALRRAILSNSSSKSFAAAAREWTLQALPPPLDDPISCEACGTHVLKTARIHNGATGATLIIGLTCYDHLIQMGRHGKIELRLVPADTFIRSRRQWYQARLAERYTGDTGIILKSWTGWLVDSLAHLSPPAAVRDGVAELNYHGIITTDDALDACIEFHDANRLFPIGVLLRPGWRKYVPNAPDVLTIIQARDLIARIAELSDQARQVAAVPRGAVHTQPTKTESAPSPNPPRRRCPHCGANKIGLEAHILAKHPSGSGPSIERRNERLGGMPGDSRAARPWSEVNSREEQEEDSRMLNKTQVASYLAERCHVPPRTCLDILGELAALAARHARNGFVMPGVGKLVVVRRVARTGRDPHTGLPVKIPAREVLKFRIAKSMKDAALGWAELP
jgi:DNA-binding protein HU-beta